VGFPNIRLCELSEDLVAGFLMAARQIAKKQIFPAFTLLGCL